MNLYSVGGQVGFSSFFFSPVFVCCLITDKGMYVVEKQLPTLTAFFPPTLTRRLWN